MEQVKEIASGTLLSRFAGVLAEYEATISRDMRNQLIWLENVVSSLISWSIDVRTATNSLAAIEGTLLAEELTSTLDELAQQCDHPDADVVDDEASAPDILDGNLQGLATTDADADPNLLERFADVSSQSSSTRCTGAHEGASTSGLLSLEKELVCFICAEVLYQPLTLIDCLHTSCGSCLKEWFSYQYKKASHSRSSQTFNPYTCPICRANVKDARHNATVSRLLDMFLSANPEKAWSTQEKEDMAKAYKPGEDILPKLEASRRHDQRARRAEEAAEETKRRMIEKARERSLGEMRGRGLEHHSDGLTTPDTRHGSGRSGSRDSRDRDARRERRREQERQERRRRAEAGEAAQAREGDMTSTEARPGSGSASLPLPPTSRHPDAIPAWRSREISHQASLRSLISASDSGAVTGDNLNEV